jgi:putative transcriptional regulator
MLSQLHVRGYADGMNFLAILLRGSTALVLTIATVETFGPALDSRERLTTTSAHQSTCGARGAFQSLAGQVLVSGPDMPDATFAKSVIYVLQHDGEGAVGIVLTSPLPHESDGLKLHDGGPVGRDTLFLLHSSDYVRPTTKMLEAGLAVTLERAAIDDIREGKGPQRSILAWGYAGWGPSQLDGEVAAGTWIVENADAARVLSYAIAKE